MSLLYNHGATLRSVRLHSAGGDALRARQRLERALADVDWSPPGLPARAMLFVRRLVADGRRGLRPQAEGGGLGQGVSAALRAHAHTARRPWLHDDAGRADAVLFADEAELLACLWRDWARGALAQRWWWRNVMGGQDAAAWLRLQAWPRGEWVAPALALLAGHGDAVACVACLPARDAERALQAVIAAYGLVHLGQWAPAVLPQDDAGPAQAALNEPDGAPPRAGGGLRSTARRRLLGLVPEFDTAQLAPAQRRLLAVALGVVRAPAWARSPDFAAALAQSELTPRADEPLVTPAQRGEARDVERSSMVEPPTQAVANAAPTSPPPKASPSGFAAPADATVFIAATAGAAAREASQPPARLAATPFEAVPAAELRPLVARPAATVRDVIVQPLNAGPPALRSKCRSLNGTR